MEARFGEKYRLLVAVVVVLIPLLLIYEISRAGVGYTNPVPTLPPGNLLTYDDAWFRDLTSPPDLFPCGWASWLNEDEKGALSRGEEKNPSPDELYGTAAQWDEATGCMQEEACGTHIIVSAPDPHIGLQFQFWQVSRHLQEGTAVIYGCADETCLDGTAIWSPWVSYHGALYWQQEPLTTTLLVETYPYYKLRLTCQYAGGNAGCKYTGVYLAPLSADDHSPTPTIPATATSTLTFTPTATETPVLVPTPTLSPTVTSTPTLSATTTLLPTVTAVQTAIVTHTPTMAATSTPMPTRIPTKLPTATPLLTSTRSPGEYQLYLPFIVLR